ncbi:MAG: GrpB family protein [Ruminococcus sp.]|jgi:GrpB-like predicted nucleotidyltransferase (UPF0157 family)
MPQHIIVTEYSAQWPDLFEKEKKLIQNILKDNCRAIYHIGSTSVEGMKAKPIIDIMPVVKSLGLADEKREEFENEGYEYLGEFGIPGRRYLRKGGDERTHQIHIFEQKNFQEIERHLALRDYLRYHREEAEAYGELKRRLALRFPYDIEGYCEGKDAFVSELEKKAMKWKGEYDGNRSENI